MLELQLPHQADCSILWGQFPDNELGSFDCASAQRNRRLHVRQLLLQSARERYVERSGRRNYMLWLLQEVLYVVFKVTAQRITSN